MVKSLPSNMNVPLILYNEPGDFLQARFFVPLFQISDAKS